MRKLRVYVRSGKWEVFGFELRVLESASSRKNISDLRHVQ